MHSKIICAVLISLLANIAIADIKPFTSDGCSAFPDGTIEEENLWLACCKQHDLAYWMGGSSDERLTADKALKACVERVGEPEVAKLMLLGVRVGGTPYLPTKFRWGYGWPYFRGYKPVSQEEQQQIKRHNFKGPEFQGASTLDLNSQKVSPSQF